MKRTGRTLAILTVVAWLAALTPALAGAGPVDSATPGPAGDDPVRVGIGIGGEVVDILSHDDDEEEDEDEDNGDEDNGDEDEDNGDEDEDNGDEDEGDENGDSLLGLLVGGDDDDGGLLDEVVEVVEEVLEVLFGEDEDSVDSVNAAAVPVALATPADDDGLVGELIGDDDDGLLDGLLGDDDGLADLLEEILDEVTEPVDTVVCIVDRRLNPPGSHMPCA